MTAGTPTAGAVIVGNEILSGKVQDENTPFLVAALRSVGVALKAVSVIPDERDPIVDTVRDFHRRFDHVFTSGGVGPTHDDITVACVAAALDREVVTHPGLDRRIRELFGERLKDAHLRMALVPEGTELLEGPGLFVPCFKVENVYILPGIPSLFQEKVQFLKGRIAASPWHARYVYVTSGEGTLAPILDEVVARFPDVDVGSYPRFDAADYRVRVTLESKDEARTEAATAALVERLEPATVVRVEEPAR